MADDILEPEQEDSKEKKPKKEKIKHLNLIPNLISWVKLNNGEIGYLVYNNGNMEIQDKYTKDGLTYKPREDMPFLLPDESIIRYNPEYNPKKLLSDLETYIYNHVELPDDKPCHYLILALWIIHTYCMEKCTTTPLIYAHGQKECGKSRLGTILSLLAFNGLYLTAMTAATLYRIKESYNPTILIDEIALLGKNGNPEMADLLKSRYKNTCVVPRCNMLKKEKDEIVDFYKVWGPTVLTTTENLGEYLDSRSLEFLMKKNTRGGVEKVINESAATELRNRLIYFRHKWLPLSMPESESVAHARLGEILNPLYKILLICDNTDERKTMFNEFTLSIDTERKEREYEGHRADIFKTLLLMILDRNPKTFITKELVAELNKGKQGKNERLYTDKYIGDIIHVMGFKRHRIGSKRGWIADDKLIKSLKIRYGIEDDFEEDNKLPF